MITYEFEKKPKTLAEFYEKIRAAQEQAHGEKYCNVHEAITSSLRNVVSAPSYRELGIKQGASAAAAMLAGPFDVTLVDKSLHHFRPFQKLFEAHAEANGMRLSIFEQNSLAVKFKEPADVLFVDTVHLGGHLFQELSRHSPLVSYRIVVHDTVSVDMKTAVDRFCANSDFDVEEQTDEGTGYTVLERRL